MSSNTVSFSKIFNDKKCLAVYFPSDISRTYQLVRYLMTWTPFFQKLHLVFHDYQTELYKRLINDNKINVESFKNSNQSNQFDLILMLSPDRSVQKSLKKKYHSSAILGYGKYSNVRFMPLPEDPYKLSVQVAELLKLPSVKDGKGNETDFDRRIEPDSGLSKKQPECDFVIDINSWFGRFRISRSLKSLTPPYSLLLTQTGKPNRKSCLRGISKTEEKSTEKRLFSLLEVMQYSLSASKIITDNPSFYELVSEFDLREKAIFYDKSTPFREIIEIITGKKAKP